MGLHQFIKALQAEQMQRNELRLKNLDAEYDLKLLRAQIEFLNSVNDARRNAGLSFEANLDVSDLLKISGFPNQNRIEQKEVKDKIYSKRQRYGFIR